MKTIWLSYIFTLFSTISVCGQVYITSETNVKEAFNNDIITLTIAVEISGEDLIQESPIKLPDFHKFDVLDYSSEQNTIIDPVRKVRVNQMVYQFLLQPKQSGAIKIGSALVKVNGKIYKSEAFDISIKDLPRRQSEPNRNLASAQNSPTNLHVTLDGRDVYKNQGFVATLSITSKDFDNFRKIKNIYPPKSSNLIIQPISLKKSDIEKDQKSGLMSQTVGLYIVFPKTDGPLEVPPFSADFEDKLANRINSNKTNIMVKPLPSGAPEGFKDFVGNFSLEFTNVESIPQPIEINKPIDIVIKLVGQGNLSANKIPKLLSTEDYDIFPPKLVKHLKTIKSGIVGTVEAHYVLVPKKAGNITIKTEKAAFFNPEKKLYQDIGDKSIVVRTMTPSEIEKSKTALQKVNEYTNTVLDKVNTPVLQTNNLKLEKKTKFNWAAVAGNMGLIGAVCIFFFLIRNSYQKKKLTALIKEEQKRQQPKVTTIAETEALLRNKKSLDIHNRLTYAEMLLNQQKHALFFEELTSLSQDINDKYQAFYHLNYEDYLHKTDATIAEEYNVLLEEINTEKYSPITNEIKLREIIVKLKSFYSTIKE